MHIEPSNNEYYTTDLYYVFDDFIILKDQYRIEKKYIYIYIFKEGEKTCSPLSKRYVYIKYWKEIL